VAAPINGSPAPALATTARLRATRTPRAAEVRLIVSPLERRGPWISLRTIQACRPGERFTLASAVFHNRVSPRLSRCSRGARVGDR
jgi:hypothetical protein